MTNNSRDCAPLDGTRKKPGFVYQEVPSDEATPGTTEKDLGACWGLENSGKLVVAQGPATRARAQAQVVPGDLQDHPEDESLDQPDISGGDRQLILSLDQSVRADGERQTRGRDQSGGPDGDQDGETEKPSLEDQLSYTSEDGIRRERSEQETPGARGVSTNE